MKSLFVMLLSIVTLSAQAGDFEIWLNKQYQISVTKLKANINRADTLPGTVVASPSKSNPNYYYHWVRDASLVMLTIERMFDRSTLVADRDDLLKLIIDYADLTRLHQSQEMQAPGRLGEVKFNVDGTPFVGPWGRPQNDGPALRALTFIKLANHFLKMVTKLTSEKFSMMVNSQVYLSLKEISSMFRIAGKTMISIFGKKLWGIISLLA